jgi:hypothetical protein
MYVCMYVCIYMYVCTHTQCVLCTYVPGATHLAASANVRDGVDNPAIEQCSLLVVEHRVDAHTYSTVSVHTYTQIYKYVHAQRYDDQTMNEVNTCMYIHIYT